MPVGALYFAFEAAPSTFPLPPPNVVTTPKASIARIRWLSFSTTKTVPAESTAIAYGLLNCAFEPTPSVAPSDPATPATVVTNAAASILRTT